MATPFGGGGDNDGDAGRQQLHVHEMMWSSDSSVLALWIIKKKKRCVQQGADASMDSWEETCGMYSYIHACMYSCRMFDQLLYLNLRHFLKEVCVCFFSD